MIGAMRDGRLVALRVEILHSTGAYVDTGIHVMIGATHNSTGAYEFPHCRLEGISVYTNTPPVGAFRGYGHQESQLAVERMMDILARELKMNSVRLREINYLGAGKFTALGEKLWKSNGDIRKCSRFVEETPLFRREAAGR